LTSAAFANGEDAWLLRSTTPGSDTAGRHDAKVSGFDGARHPRNTPETANLKIIMLTALSQESDKERAQTLV